MTFPGLGFGWKPWGCGAGRPARRKRAQRCRCLPGAHPQCLALARAEMRLRLHVCRGGAALSWQSEGRALRGLTAGIVCVLAMLQRRRGCCAGASAGRRGCCGLVRASCWGWACRGTLRAPEVLSGSCRGGRWRCCQGPAAAGVWPCGSGGTGPALRWSRSLCGSPSSSPALLTRALV